MRLGQAKRVGSARTFRHDRGIRRLRPRNDMEYPMSMPENARRLLAILEDARAGRNMMRFGSMDELRDALRLAEEE